MNTHTRSLGKALTRLGEEHEIDNPTQRVVRWRLYLGAAVSAAFLTPLLGGGALIVPGITARLLSYVLIGFAFGIGWSNSIRWQHRHRNSARGVSIAVFALLALAALSLPSSRPLIVLDSVATIETYGGYKLTRFVLLSLPLIVLAASMSSFMRSAAFRIGLVVGVFLTGLLASVRLLAAWETLGDPGAFLADRSFSTINLSIVFLFQIAAATSLLPVKPTRMSIVLYTGVTVGALSGCLIVDQRAPLLLGIVIAATAVLRLEGTGRRYLAIRYTSVFAIAGALPLFILESASKVDTASGAGLQSRRLLSLLSPAGDGSVSLRLEMWDFGLSEGFNNLIGHGTGSFADAGFGALYPHNILIESLYEWGLAAFAIVITLVARSVWVVWHLFRRPTTSLAMWGIVIGLLIVMKSGDLTTIGVWLFWLYLAEGDLRREIPSGSRHTKPAPLVHRPDA